MHARVRIAKLQKRARVSAIMLSAQVPLNSTSRREQTHSFFVVVFVLAVPTAAASLGALSGDVANLKLRSARKCL